MQSKKQLILWVLNVLNNESDERHPITQTEIAMVISKVYPCDRKTVGRNIKFLMEMGYPIIKVGRGFYLERRIFSVDEIAFIKAAIIGAPGKSEADKEALADQVEEVLCKMYRR